MTHPYSANTTVVVAPATTTADLRGLLAAASHHLGAALGALALHDVTLATDTTVADSLNFCEASLARLSLAEPQQTAMELDTTTVDLDLAATVPQPRHRESPKDRVARRKLLLNLHHTGAKPKKPTCSSSSATAASSSPATDPSAVLLIDSTLAPARNVRARGF